MSEAPTIAIERVRRRIARRSGVSAPAGFGVPYEVIHACALEATQSGKLALADVVELNPALDVDGRTAKAAARLIHTIVSRHRTDASLLA